MYPLDLLVFILGGVEILDFEYLFIFVASFFDTYSHYSKSSSLFSIKFLIIKSIESVSSPYFIFSSSNGYYVYILSY